ncbi:MAG: carbohydrate ABC transporter permease [Treponema sp.]|jgi:multiple sugar transport system permease protein|nr:carbohydrate ABC transporter permease [Treponema sp.]
MNKRNIILFIPGIVLLAFALLAIIPFVLMILTSFTDKTAIDFAFDFSKFQINNYIRIFRNLNLGRNLFNSMVVTLCACTLNGIISSMAAFGFAKKNFPGREKLFLLYLATMMIPGQVTLIPVFIMIRGTGLMNTYPALFLPVINAFGVFLIRQFMFNLPNELLESAKIDGASEPVLFTRIALPLIQPVLISLTIFTFISVWNDFLWPLVVSSKPEMHTLTLAVSVLRNSYQSNYGLVMAGSTLAFMPPFILYLILQKQFVEGIALSGIKG